MWAGDTSGDLFEEWLLDLDKLCGFNHVQDFFQLSKKHHLEHNDYFYTVRHDPEEHEHVKVTSRHRVK